MYNQQSYSNHGTHTVYGILHVLLDRNIMSWVAVLSVVEPKIFLSALALAPKSRRIALWLQLQLPTVL
jgi:hypothetical protein